MQKIHKHDLKKLPARLGPGMAGEIPGAGEEGSGQRLKY
jgi:hypothetical protein